MKKPMQITIMVSLLLLSAVFVYAAAEVNVNIDGLRVEFNQPSGAPFIDENGRTQVPFRETLETFGATVDWDAGSRIAIAKKDGITVKIPIGTDYIYKNDVKIMNDTKSALKDGRTYLPIRVVLEAFDANVDWDAKTKAVMIQSGYIKYYDYDLSKYVKLGQYKGLKAPATGSDVSDKEVREEIQYRLEMAGTYDKLTKGTVRSGDTANIDYVGRKDGVPFEGGTATGYDLTIGSGVFISGFEDGLIGKNIGETAVLKLTFPEQYLAELAGQKVEFSVKINFIERPVPVKFDIEFVKKHSNYKTVKEYEDSIRAELKETKIADAAYLRESLLWEKVVENCTIIDYPEKELNSIIDERNDSHKRVAASMGMIWSDFLEYSNITQEEYEEYILEGAEQQIEQELILVAIARQEGIELSEEEYEKGKLQFLTEMGFDSEKEYKEASGGKSFEQEVGRKNIQMALIYERVLEFVDKSAVTM